MNGPQRERRAHRLALAALGRTKARVLVACDLREEALAVTALLRRCGLSADWAIGGEAAIGRVLDGEAGGRGCDLLLIDLFMPHCDGHEAARALRLAGYPPDLLPIVALTERAPDALAHALIRSAEMQGWLARPVSLMKLVPLLNRRLPHRITGGDTGDGWPLPA